MKFVSRILALSALAVSAAAAHAALTYNIVNATVSYNTGEVENLANSQNGPGNSAIDFFSNTSPMFVATVNTDRKHAIVDITYEVTSDSNIGGLNLVFTGWNFGTGTINYREHAEMMDGTDLGDISGSLTAGSPFTQVDDLTFSQAVNAYRVHKVFLLDIDEQSNTPSFSSLGLIEQNAVPEPATMAIMGAGALGVLARRRRK